MTAPSSLQDALAAELADVSPKHRFAGLTWGRISDPLLRNATALAVNTVTTSFLGFLFWVLAARFYGPAEVGRASALISTLLLISGIAQLNLESVLTRFLPRAGPSTRRVLVASYGASAAVAVTVGVLALPLVNRSAAGWLTGMGPAAALWFVAAAVAICIYDLQDGALVGLREAIWVPVENISSGLGRVLLVVVLAAAMEPLGIFTAWMVPMALSLIPVNLLLFRRLIPRHSRRAGSRTERIRARQLARYASLDYGADLLALGATNLLPLIVAARVGIEANGYFYVAWLIGAALDGALISVGTSLTAEGAHDPRRLPTLIRTLSRRGAAVTGAVVAGLILSAPYLLAIMGSGYSTEATDLLRLLALAVWPRAVIILWASVVRVHRWVGRILLVQGVLATAVLALSVPLLDRYGITGVGMAYLFCNLAVAVPLLIWLWRHTVSTPADVDTTARGNRG